MFSNNIEYTNYNIETNFIHENIDPNNTADIINSSKKNANNYKNNKKNNLEFMNPNLYGTNNFVQNNLNDIKLSYSKRLNLKVI